MDITERKITKIAREAEKLVLRTLREKDVGTAEIDLIHALRHNPGCTQAALAELLHADKAAIADHVTRYYPLGFTLDEIRDAYQFDVSCAGSVPQAMEAFLEAESFEDAVRNAISIGGDSDTIACMAGAVAAAFFGIPKDIREAAQPFLEGEVKRVYQAFIQRY